MVHEQEEMPALRRRLWMVLWFILVVTVLWTLVWFIFFRQSPTKTADLKGSNASQSQSSTGSSNTSSNSGSSKSSSSSSNSTPVATPPPNQQLANAGAGNILIPFAVASVTGTTVYYIRLRRKLLS